MVRCFLYDAYPQIYNRESSGTPADDDARGSLYDSVLPAMQQWTVVDGGGQRARVNVSLIPFYLVVSKEVYRLLFSL